MKKWLFVVFLSLAISLSALHAEGPTAFDEFRQALGLSAGTLGNYGLSYAFWVPPFGLSATGYAFYNQAAGASGDPFMYALTLEFMYRLAASDFSEAFGTQAYLFLAGNASSGLPLYDASLGDNAGLVAGIGVETLLFRHFAFSLEAGYFVAFPFVDPTRPLVNLMGQTSFRYRF
jgi:hypothetical protein